MEILSDRIIFNAEDFVGGLAPTTVTSLDTKALRIFGGYTFAVNFDPFDTIPGIAYPGKTPTNLTNVDSDSPAELLVDATTDYGLSFAFALGTTLIEQFEVIVGGTADDLTVSGGVFPHTITPHGHSSLDASKGSVEMYNVSGTNKLFYSWNDGTDWDVGIYDPSSDAFDDDFMSTVPTTPLAGSDLTGGQGKHHPLHVSKQDDILYQGSGRFVHSYDGTADTFTAQHLTLPLNFEMKGFADTQYDLVEFADSSNNLGRKASAKAFFWAQDRPSSFYKVVDLEDYQVAAPFEYRGTVGCFTSKRSGKIALRIYDGTVFVKVFEFDGTAPSIGGVDIINNVIQWNNDGKVYQWGDYKGLFGTNTGHQISSYGASSGFYKIFTSGTPYISGGTGTTGLAILSGFDGTARVSTIAAFPSFGFNKRGKIKAVKYTFAKNMSTGQSMTLNLFTGGDTIIVGSVSTVTDSTRTIVFTRDNSDNDFGEFEYVIVDLTWGSVDTSDAIGVQKVEVFYETIVIAEV